jgi:hypothetical protein
MNQKGFVNVILVVIIVVLAGALGYFTLVKKSPQVTQQTSTPTPTLTTIPTPTAKISTLTPTPVSTPSLPTSCTDKLGGAPVITSLSTYSGPVGTKLEIRGCNFSGFEGDKNAWIENASGVKGLLYSEIESTSKLLKVTLESPLCQKDTTYSGLLCDAWLTLTPGKYKIYVMPFGKASNKVNFTITP